MVTQNHWLLLVTPAPLPSDLRDAVMARYRGACLARDISKRFNGVHPSKVNSVLSEVEEMIKKAKETDHPLSSQMDMERSSSHDASKFVYRWVSKRCNASIPDGVGYTESELQAGSYAVLSGKVQANHAFTLYGFIRKVLLTGGSEVINGTQNYGIAKVQIFDPAEDTLIDAEHQMYFPRWYPSVTTLGNSLIVVQGGTGMYRVLFWFTCLCWYKLTD